MRLSDDLVDLEKFATFSAERRDSVLKFSEKHLNLLLAYHKNLVSLQHLRIIQFHAGILGPIGMFSMVHQLILNILKNTIQQHLQEIIVRQF